MTTQAAADINFTTYHSFTGNDMLLLAFQPIRCPEQWFNMLQVDLKL
jgi:hypothetical protein